MANPILSNGQASYTSIYTTTTNPELKVGTRGYLPDGRVFYWTKNDTASALNVGQLIVAPDIVANHGNLAMTAGGGQAGQNMLGNFTTGATAMTADQYAEGYVAITDGTGQGQLFKIKSNIAVGASTASGANAVVLYDNITTTTDATSTCSFIPNPYDAPQVSVTDQLDIPVGVPTTTLAVGSTTAQYGWLQTWGPAAVLVDESFTALGQAVTVGTGVAGALEQDDTATTVSQEFIVGYNITAFVDTEYQIVDLRIRP